MIERLEDIIRCQSHPLAPKPTGVKPNLRKVVGIRAVLFDVYGTLFISASGGADSAVNDSAVLAFTQSLEAVGLEGSQTDYRKGLDVFQSVLRTELEAVRSKGVLYPEVDILEIWSRTLEVLRGSGWVSDLHVDLKRLSVEYEVRCNPVWPMPNLTLSLSQLRHRGLGLGLISNAQFYTPHLFSGLLNSSPESLGFDPSLFFLSYQHGHAKPGVHLYQRAAEALRSNGIESDSILYAGNDMLNDILPASRVGFRTALFAGDARSLRRRQDDPRVDGLEADLLISDLVQIPECLG